LKLFIPGVEKSLARPGRKQFRKHVRDAHDFNNIEKRAVIRFFFLQRYVPKEIYTILTETSAFFLPGRAKNLSAPLYKGYRVSLPGVKQTGHGVDHLLHLAPKVKK